MLLFPTMLHAKVSFSSDEVIITLPHHIQASGNTTFSSDDVDINAQSFEYDVMSANGSFESNVKLTYLNASLIAQSIEFNTSSQAISGKSNILFDAPNLSAQSDSFTIEDTSLLTLRDNVLIQRNDGQIQSNELIYNLKTDSILSTERVKLKLMIEE